MQLSNRIREWSLVSISKSWVMDRLLSQTIYVHRLLSQQFLLSYKNISLALSPDSNLRNTFMVKITKSILCLIPLASPPFSNFPDFKHHICYPLGILTDVFVLFPSPPLNKHLKHVSFLLTSLSPPSLSLRPCSCLMNSCWPDSPSAPAFFPLTICFIHSTVANLLT